MSGLPYYPRYPRDFFDGTAGMSLEEKGAYGLVLDLIYMMGARGLPDDSQYIAGQIGTSVRKWNIIRAKLIERKKLAAEGGILVNVRAEKEKAKQEKYRNQQSQNASSTDTNPSSEAEGQKADLEIISRTSGDNPEIISSKSGDNNAENHGAGNKINTLAKPPPTYREDTDTESYIDGGVGTREGETLTYRERVIVAAGHPPSGLTAAGKMIGNFTDFTAFQKAVTDLGLSEDEAIRVVEGAANNKQDGPASSLAYFVEPLRRYAGTKNAPSIRAIIPSQFRTDIEGDTHDNRDIKNRSSEGRQNRPDPALENIARLARLGTS